MADVALVHLGIDSSGVVAGEKAATQAFAAIERAMSAAEKSFQRFGQQAEGQSKKAEESFKKTTTSANNMGSALGDIGGPIGQLTGSMGGLVSQASGLVTAFGAVTAGAVALVAGIVAVSATVVSFAREGVGLSDKLDDIAGALGFTHEQMERFNAAARVQGEDVGFLERSFAAFESAIKQGIEDPSSNAMRSLEALRVNMVNAGKAPQAEFLRLVGVFDKMTDSLEGSTAAHETFGRGTNALKRISAEFRNQLLLNNETLESNLLTVSKSTTDMARQVDVAFNTVILQFENLKRKLVVDLGPAFADFAKTAGEALKDLLPTLRAVAFGVAAIARPFAGAFKVDTFQPQPTRGGEFLPAGAAASEKAVQELQKMNAGFEKLYGRPRTPGEAEFVPKLPKGGGAGKIDDTAFKAEQALQKARLDAAREGSKLMQEQWDKDLADLERFAKELNTVLVDGLDTTLVGVGRKVGEIGKGVPLAGAPGGIQQGGPGQPFPGAPIFDKGPAADKIRTERQAALDEQFQGIFDDFLSSILTARATVGEAFGAFALGIVDVFAAQFVEALRKEFIDPVIEELTNLLVDSIGTIFKGFGGGSGVKGFFGGILKGIGTIFGGLFATGGTLAPGKFGIAGERGPELIFSGSQPMHIAPVTAGSAGNVFNINVGVNAPQGIVDRRTQDQIAATVLNAVRRAERNQGAR